MPSFSFSPKKGDSAPSTPETKQRKTSTGSSDDEVIINPRNAVEAYPNGNPLASPSSDRGMREQQAQIQRILEKIAAEGAEKAPTWAQPVFEKLVPVCMATMKAFETAVPYLQKAYDFGREMNERLPIDCLVALWGLILCFFGGTFPLSIAAYEAFKISGWDQTRQAFGDLSGEYRQYVKTTSEATRINCFIGAHEERTNEERNCCSLRSLRSSLVAQRRE